MVQSVEENFDIIRQALSNLGILVASCNTPFCSSPDHSCIGGSHLIKDLCCVSCETYYCRDHREEFEGKKICRSCLDKARTTGDWNFAD